MTKIMSSGQQEAVARLVVFPLVVYGLVLVTNWLMLNAMSLIIFRRLAFDMTVAWSPCVGEVVLTVCVVFALSLMRCLGDQAVAWRSWFALEGAVRQSATGMVLGLGVCFPILLIPLWAGLYQHIGWHLYLPWLTLAFAALIGFSEEVTFRGYVFGIINAQFGPRKALLVSSLGFALVHLLSPPSGVGSAIGYALNAFVAGLFLGAVYWLTRRLWLPVAFHIAWDFCCYIIPMPHVQSIQHPWITTIHISDEAATWVSWMTEAYAVLLAVMSLYLFKRRQGKERATRMTPAGVG
jgi:membrane protease YdiL (CAAX protease family)